MGETFVLVGIWIPEKGIEVILPKACIVKGQKEKKWFVDFCHKLQMELREQVYSLQFVSEVI